jgi:oligoendopeptidase F
VARFGADALAGASHAAAQHAHALRQAEVSAHHLMSEEKGILPVADLCRLMTDAQWATYGDGLRRDSLHPYMWAVKPHYYSSTFYNWPCPQEPVGGV